MRSSSSSSSRPRVSKLFACVAAAAPVVALVAPPASGADVYWDINAANPGATDSDVAPGQGVPLVRIERENPVAACRVLRALLLGTEARPVRRLQNFGAEFGRDLLATWLPVWLG